MMNTQPNPGEIEELFKMAWNPKEDILLISRPIKNAIELLRLKEKVRKHWEFDIYFPQHQFLELDARSVTESWLGYLVNLFSQNSIAIYGTITIDILFSTEEVYLFGDCTMHRKPDLIKIADAISSAHNLIKEYLTL